MTPANSRIPPVVELGEAANRAALTSIAKPHLIWPLWILALACQVDEPLEPGMDSTGQPGADAHGDGTGPKADTTGTFPGGGESTTTSGGDDGDSGETGSDTTGEPWVPHCDGLPPPLRTIEVGSLSELGDKLADAEPGDEIVLADGDYSNNSRRTWSAEGTEDNPVVLRAESILGATISGDAGIDISDAQHFVVCGFRFVHRTTSTGSRFDIGMEVESSHHVRVTRNYFSLIENGYAHWLMITGQGSQHNRIDHNKFEDKPEEGLFIAVYGGDEDSLSEYDVIDHNYFYDHSWNSEGGEAIRIGSSSKQMVSSFTRVESNLFEECNGDAESISSKSTDTFYLYNTFRNSERGSLVLRHGHRAHVEGNYFMSGSKNGIRMYGDGHVIIGNYFDGTVGTGGYAPIAIGSGTALDQGSYDATEDALIAFNTLVGNSDNILVGRGDNSYEPRRVTIANNIIVGDQGSAADPVTAHEDFTWQGNILWGDIDDGVMPSSGYTRVDPKLVRDPDGVLRLTAESPAIDAAVNWSEYTSIVTQDQDGQVREGPGDVGADERSRQQVVRGPLSEDDVGPLAP